MKKLIIFILIATLTLIFFLANCISTRPKGIEDTPLDNSCYYLDNYLICPQTKKIKYGIMVGGVNWDGFKYIVDPTIKYDKTQLYFIEGKLYFKEYLKNVEVDSLRILETKTSRNTLYTEITDGDSIFVCTHNTLRASKPYKPEEERIKNSLMPKGEVIKRGKTYTAYADSIVVSMSYRTERIDLDLSKTKEYLIDKYYDTYIITDGNKTYLHSLFYQGTQLMELDFLRGKNVEIITDKQHLWKIHQPSQTICMSLSKTNKERIEYPSGTNEWRGLLLSTTDGYYIVNRNGKYKKGKYFSIVNEDENGFESYDTKTMNGRLVILNSNYYIQNSKLYGYEYPVHKQDSIDVNGLFHLKSENISTEFYTDGNLLIDLGEVRGISTREEELIMEQRIISEVDLESLIIINQNTLKDENNIYCRLYNKVEVIPLEEIGIPINIISTPQTSKLIR